MAKRQPFTIDSNLDKIILKIEEKPYRVMNELGKTLTREMRNTTMKSMYDSRTKILSKMLGYWARKKERDLLIGFKVGVDKNPYGAGPALFGDMITGHKDPIKPVVQKNLQNIADLITVALQEIDKDKS